MDEFTIQEAALDFRAKGVYVYSKYNELKTNMFIFYSSIVFIRYRDETLILHLQDRTKVLINPCNGGADFYLFEKFQKTSMAV